MADYRQWCDTCNAEIGFGGHEQGCPVPAKIRAAEVEREWKREQARKKAEAPFQRMTQDELLDVLVALDDKIAEVRETLKPLEEKRKAALSVVREKDWLTEFLYKKREAREVHK